MNFALWYLNFEKTPQRGVFLSCALEYNHFKPTRWGNGLLMRQCHVMCMNIDAIILILCHLGQVHNAPTNAEVLYQTAQNVRLCRAVHAIIKYV